MKCTMKTMDLKALKYCDMISEKKKAYTDSIDVVYRLVAGISSFDFRSCRYDPYKIRLTFCL